MIASAVRAASLFACVCWICGAGAASKKSSGEDERHLIVRSSDIHWRVRAWKMIRIDSAGGLGVAKSSLAGSVVYSHPRVLLRDAAGGREVLARILLSASAHLVQ